MKTLQLYRKRFVPSENILLNDVILEHTEDIVITKWNTIRPKTVLHHGCSCYYLKEGWKVSKFYSKDHSLLYWYCDIVEFDYCAEDNSLVVSDLLADVIIYPDGKVEVVDLDELAEAHRDKIITDEQLHKSLMQLNSLLSIISQNRFTELQIPLNNMGL